MIFCAGFSVAQMHRPQALGVSLLQSWGPRGQAAEHTWAPARGSGSWSGVTPGVGDAGGHTSAPSLPSLRAPHTGKSPLQPGQSQEGLVERGAC